MSLDLALNAASTGLLSINANLAVVSQNVANAGTPGYNTETVTNTELSASGQGYGVKSGPAIRQDDPALQAAVFDQNASVASQQVTSDALTTLDAAQGTTGAGDDLASALGTMTNAFTTLSADPSNQTQQAAVVTAAQQLTSNIQGQASTYAQARQSAQDSLVTDVATLNAAVQSIGTLSQQIVAAKVQGQSTADLESERNVQEQTASQIAGLQFLPQADGDVVAVIGASQVSTTGPLPGPFGMASASLGAGAAAPAFTLSGQDITSQVTTGSIGANLTLRDTTIPTQQAGLDEFAETLATRFSNQGLTLFTDPQGNVPAAGGNPVQANYVGFSGTIQVNAAVVASPNLVRDGTNAIAGSPTGASAFTPNPALTAGGQASFGTLINRVLVYALGPNAQTNVAQTAPNTTGLGATGSISLSYGSGTTLANFASNFVSNQSEQAGAAKNALTNAQSLQTTLQSKLQTETGVSVDTELSHMIVLQNAYGANAKIITAVQSMWTTLLGAVTA